MAKNYFCCQIGKLYNFNRKIGLMKLLNIHLDLLKFHNHICVGACSLNSAWFMCHSHSVTGWRQTTSRVIGWRYFRYLPLQEHCQHGFHGFYGTHQCSENPWCVCHSVSCWRQTISSVIAWIYFWYLLLSLQG